MVASLSWFRS